MSSKQQDYQQLSSSEVPRGEDYGFAAQRGPCPTHGAYQPNFGPVCTCGAPGGTPMNYMAFDRPGARVVAGYPAAGMMPVGMGVQDPLGMRCGKKRARRMACAANGCRGCRNCRGCQGCRRRRRAGPVHLLFGLARAAFHSAENHHRKQPPNPAHNPTSSSQ